MLLRQQKKMNERTDTIMKVAVVKPSLNPLFAASLQLKLFCEILAANESHPKAQSRGWRLSASTYMGNANKSNTKANGTIKCHCELFLK